MPSIPYWLAASQSLQPLHTNCQPLQHGEFRLGEMCHFAGIKAQGKTAEKNRAGYCCTRPERNTNSILSHLNVLPFVFKIQSYLKWTQNYFAASNELNKLFSPTQQNVTAVQHQMSAKYCQDLQD